jgi:hypothetical protein
MSMILKMKNFLRSFNFTFLTGLYVIPCLLFAQKITIDEIPYRIYPKVNEARPDLPSPFVTSDEEEFVVAVTQENKYAIIQVTLSNDRGICPQLIIDHEDFPTLAKTGLHSEEELNRTTAITGRPLDEITKLGYPLGLSHDGFMAEDENILSIIKGDNQLVQKLGLTHPKLAKPLFHVLNIMDQDLDLKRWNMAHHRWENIQYFYYNDQTVYVDAGDTKGGQESIFDDNIQGAFYIKLWREFSEDETKFLRNHYNHLSETQFDTLKSLLSSMNTGEIEPQYIMRYGFYEGHTSWRTDPIAISFVFGLKNLQELESVLNGKLFTTLTSHYNK